MEPVPKYLEKRRRQWYAVLDVPKDLRGAVGQSRFRQSLRTDSLREAERLVGPVVSLWKHRLDAASADDPHDRALALFRHTLALSGGDKCYLDVVEDQIVDYANKLEEVSDYRTAKRWYDKATGQRLDFDELREEWLSSINSKSKTKTMHRQAFKLLQSQHQDIEDITRRVASQFVSEVLSVGREPATVNRMLSTYESFWRWLENRGYREDVANPWARQRLVKKSSGGREHRGGEKRRPFTQHEGAKLISAVDAAAAKHPVDALIVRILAATGMRIEEVCSLYLEDVEDPGSDHLVLRVVEGKTTAAQRDVPVAEPTVVAMLRSRLAATQPEAPRDTPLFPELKPDANGDRYGALSN